MTKNEKIAMKNFLNKEINLSEYATKSSDFLRLKNEDEDIRPPFFHDIDRIIHSLSYTRYLDKTQVFTKNINATVYMTEKMYPYLDYIKNYTFIEENTFKIKDFRNLKYSRCKCR